MRRALQIAIGVAAAVGAATDALGGTVATTEGEAASRPVRRRLTRGVGPRWEPAGFGGGGAFICIAFDPAHPGVVYACSDVSGVFRSTDRGEHWEMRSVGLGNFEVSSLAVDPFDSTTLYAGVGALTESTRAGMYLSHDAGLTWTLLADTKAKGMTFRRMRTLDAIAPDPTRRGVILAGTRGSGIWRSVDSGATWTQVLAAPPTSATLFQPGAVPDDPTTSPYPAPVSTIVFDPVNQSTVIAGLDGAGVYRSTAAGVDGSWTPASSGLPAQAKVRDVAISSGGTLYVALASAGVYRSPNRGASWTSASGNLPLAGLEVSSVAAHPTNPQVAYVTLVTYEVPSVWKTTDGGSTWAPQGNVTFDPRNNPTRAWDQGQTYAWQVRLDPFDPDRVYYVDFWAITRSDDGAANSAEKIVGAQDTCITSLTVDTDHPAGQADTLFATQWDAGVVASTDQGATWMAVQPSEWQADVVGHYWDFAVIRVGGTKYYLTTSTTGDPETSRVQRSTDAVSWTTVLSLPTPAAGFVGAVSLAVDPRNPATLYAAIDGAGVYSSTNGGATWAPTPGQPGSNAFTYALEVDSQGRIFVGTLNDGLWRSTTGGSSWTRVLDELGTVFHAAVAPGAVYAAGTGDDINLYRSPDGGESWQRVSDFPEIDDGDGVGLHGLAVAVDPADANHLFFSLSDSWHNTDAGAGVAESTNGGATWSWVNSGLGLLSASVLTVGPDGTVYAGTSCGGIWRRRSP